MRKTASFPESSVPIMKPSAVRKCSNPNCTKKDPFSMSRITPSPICSINPLGRSQLHTASLYSSALRPSNEQRNPSSDGVRTLSHHTAQSHSMMHFRRPRPRR